MKRLILVLTVLVALAATGGCNDRGKTCPEKGAKEYKSNGEHHVCVQGPHGGGLQWQ